MDPPAGWGTEKHEIYAVEFGSHLFVTVAGADPGFPVGLGADPRQGGANIRFCQKFPKTA